MLSRAAPARRPRSAWRRARGHGGRCRRRADASSRGGATADAHSAAARTAPAAPPARSRRRAAAAAARARSGSTATAATRCAHARAEPPTRERRRRTKAARSTRAAKSCLRRVVDRGRSTEAGRAAPPARGALCGGSGACARRVPRPTLGVRRGELPRGSSVDERARALAAPPARPARTLDRAAQGRARALRSLCAAAEKSRTPRRRTPSRSTSGAGGASATCAEPARGRRELRRGGDRAERAAQMLLAGAAGCPGRGGGAEPRGARERGGALGARHRRGAAAACAGGDLTLRAARARRRDARRVAAIPVEAGARCGEVPRAIARDARPRVAAPPRAAPRALAAWCSSPTGRGRTIARQRLPRALGGARSLRRDGRLRSAARRAAEPAARARARARATIAEAHVAGAPVRQRPPRARARGAAGGAAMARRAELAA